MSTAMNFGSKSFRPVPPAKGSFPLDHDGECKDFKDVFMGCLRSNNYISYKCRLYSKQYLECRMANDLMQQEDLTKLGYSDLEEKQPSTSSKQKAENEKS